MFVESREKYCISTRFFLEKVIRCRRFLVYKSAKPTKESFFTMMKQLVSCLTSGPKPWPHVLYLHKDLYLCVVYNVPIHDTSAVTHILWSKNDTMQNLEGKEVWGVGPKKPQTTIPPPPGSIL
jgi:hypothetical protein